MPENGAAKLIVSLDDSEITIRHGQDKTILLNWKARKGDWDMIWNLLERTARKRNA